MQTARLRLYTQYATYIRVIQDALGLINENAAQTAQQHITAYTGAKHAVLTSMGRMAIYEGLCALRALNGNAPGSEIILSPITVPEVISLVHAAGYRPVFCDVAPGTWNMDVAQAEALITPRTVAIMTTHFYGNSNTLYDIRRLCDARGLLMIEDAAQALGVWNGGRHAGTVGDFGILSFSYPKNVTSFYGGCLITSRDDIADAVCARIAGYAPADRKWLHKKALACLVKDILTWPPAFTGSAMVIRYGYRHDIRAIKSIVTQDLAPGFLDTIPERYIRRISSGQAAAITDKWPQIDEDTAHRIACASIYREILQGTQGITLPAMAGERSHGYLYFPIQVEDKTAVQQALIARGLDVAVQHAPNCADLPLFKAYYRDCPNARAAFKGTVTLPTYRGFPEHKALRYAQAVKDFVTGRG